MRSQMVNIQSGTFYTTKMVGRIWAHSALDYTGNTVLGNPARFLAIKINASEPSSGDVRWVGVSLRCLSTAVEGEESGS